MAVKVVTISSQLRIANHEMNSYLLPQMLNQRLRKLLCYPSHRLPIVYLASLFHIPNILLQGFHRSLERLVLVDVDAHIYFLLEEGENDGLLAVVVLMDHDEEHLRVAHQIWDVRA